MSLEFYLAYVLACVVVVIVPGPTVTVIVANSLTHGTRAGLLNIAGTQLGLAVMMGIVLVGLAALIETMGVWFDAVRFAGAAYLVWLGWKLLRSPGSFADPKKVSVPRGGFFLQGFLVLMSNPKGAAAVRRLHPAICRSERQLCRPGCTAGRHRDGDSRHLRLGLCCRGRKSPRAAVVAAGAACFTHFRRVPDRRRVVARAGTSPLIEFHVAKF